MPGMGQRLYVRPFYVRTLLRSAAATQVCNATCSRLVKHTGCSRVNQQVFARLVQHRFSRLGLHKSARYRHPGPEMFRCAVRCAHQFGGCLLFANAATYCGASFGCDLVAGQVFPTPTELPRVHPVLQRGALVVRSLFKNDQQKVKDLRNSTKNSLKSPKQDRKHLMPWLHSCTALCVHPSQTQQQNCFCV